MILYLALAAGAYFLYSSLFGESAERAPGDSPLKVVDGAQYFGTTEKAILLANLPGLAVKKQSEGNGATTYVLVPVTDGMGDAASNAGAVVTAAITSGMMVAASVSLLSTAVVEAHHLVVAPPAAGPAALAPPGGPLALLFDPTHPTE